MKYTDSHEWLKTTGNEGVVGVSEYAQSELGDVVYVELPQVGKKIHAGEEAAVLESTKAAADVYAPITGTITEVNQALENSPELINTSPESEGWLFKMAIDDPSELDKLMDEKAYNAQFTA